MALPTAAVAGGTLLAGFAVARFTEIRPLGGMVLLAGGAWCVQQWLRSVGTGRTAALGAAFAAAFVASHPLARVLGAWPSVVSVSAATAVLVWAVADRRGVRVG